MRFGDVAQLARANDWQPRGREFESHLLPFLLLEIIIIFKNNYLMKYNVCAISMALFDYALVVLK